MSEQRRSVTEVAIDNMWDKAFPTLDRNVDMTKIRAIRCVKDWFAATGQSTTNALRQAVAQVQKDGF